jgi:enoyl-CoA hydratase
MPIVRTLDDGIAVLSLELDRGNAINHAFIEALDAALDDTAREDARAVVLTGRGKVFCGGLDLLAIADYERPALEEFLDAFEAIFERVLTFPRPVIAAINGHALAGGCILGMAADYRVMAPGSFQIGVNEVMLGLPFPAAAFEIVRRSTPDLWASTVLMQGRRFSPEEAVAAGIVHRLAGDAGVVADAVAEARRFAAGGVDAVADTKADLIAPVLARIEATRASRRARFVTHWYAPEGRTRIGALRAHLEKR